MHVKDKEANAVSPFPPLVQDLFYTMWQILQFISFSLKKAPTHNITSVDEQKHKTYPCQNFFYISEIC